VQPQQSDVLQEVPDQTVASFAGPVVGRFGHRGHPDPVRPRHRPGRPVIRSRCRPLVTGRSGGEVEEAELSDVGPGGEQLPSGRIRLPRHRRAPHHIVGGGIDLRPQPDRTLVRPGPPGTRPAGPPPDDAHRWTRRVRVDIRPVEVGSVGGHPRSPPNPIASTDGCTDPTIVVRIGSEAGGRTRGASPTDRWCKQPPRAPPTSSDRWKVGHRIDALGFRTDVPRPDCPDIQELRRYDRGDGAGWSSCSNGQRG